MAHKKKHEKMLRKRKKHNRNRLCKPLSNPKKMTERLADYEYLNPYMDTILEEYKPEDLSLYRWAHIPFIADDFRQQIYQEGNPNNPETLHKPGLDAPKEVILEYIDNFTFSNYLTIEDAKRLWRETLQNRIKKVAECKKEREKQRWIQKKGQYIIKVNYTKDTGIVGLQDDDVHKLALLYDGVNFEDLIDKSFTPVKID